MSGDDPDAVERICLTVDAGKSLQYTKELSFGPDGLWGCGLEWNVAVHPDPDAPSDEMTVDLTAQVHFGVPGAEEDGAAAAEPLLLKEGRGKQFHGRYEPGQGVQDGMVAEKVHFQIGNAFSWFRSKRLELFFVLLQPGPQPSGLDPLPRLEQSDRPARHLAGARTATSAALVALGSGASDSAPRASPRGTVALDAGPAVASQPTKYRRPPAAPRLSLLGATHETSDPEEEACICLLGTSPRPALPTGSAASGGEADERYAVGVLAQLRLDARRLCEEIEPRRAALDALRADAAQREVELAELEQGLERLVTRIAEAEGGAPASTAAVSSRTASKERSTEPAERFDLDDPGVGSGSEGGDRSSTPEAAAADVPGPVSAASPRSGDDETLQHSSPSADYEDLMDVIGKARCRRCGRRLPLDPDAMERHAEECEAEEARAAAAA